MKKITIKSIAIALLGVALIIWTYTTFFNEKKEHKRRPHPTTVTKPAEPSEPQFKLEGKLQFIAQGMPVEKANIEIEIADNDPERMQGLMYRRFMATNRGMLFIFDEDEPLSFWMKNTLIPLDMIFCKADGTIYTIHKNTTPLSVQSYPANGYGRFVVEVVAGYCDKNNIAVGDKIKFEKINQ